MELAQVMLTVPAERLGEVYAFAARLTSDATQGSADASPVPSTSRPPRSTADGQPAEDVRRLCERAYLDGSGVFQQRLLDHLADNPDEMWTVAEICEHIDRDEQHFSRAMGAFSKRMGGVFPFRKGRKGGRVAYEMPHESATIIREIRNSV